MITIVRGTTNKPVSADRLANFFATNQQYNGFLYIGYPIIGTAEGPYPIDALLVSPDKGLIIFCLIENQDISNAQEAQDDSYNKIESKLRAHKELMNGRSLQAKIAPITFAPLYHSATAHPDNEYPICNEANLGAWLDSCVWDTPDYYEKLVAVLQSISTIRKGRKKREAQNPDSRGAKLKSLEDSIANLDNLQGQAVIETVNGVQRIRGLAGSGKTIVLALKAAYLHAQHPDWKIAVTFNTRSLKGQFRQLINTFTIEQTNEEPDWDNIHIIQAWGAPGGGDRNGMYYSFCQQNEVEYHDFNSAKQRLRGGLSEFKWVCQKALENCLNSKELYDAVLVDEAQDFPPEFLCLCYAMLKAEKRLVYAYDELQNLSSKSLPPPEEIFGTKPDGTPNVRLSNHPNSPQQDIILEKCYRNSRPVLATAHALGFGIYRIPPNSSTTGLVQMFENRQLWRDVGYEVISGDLSDGQDVALARSNSSSPHFLEDHSPVDDLIQFQCFESQEEQDNWVANAICENLQSDELRSDDIVVINPNPLTTRSAVGTIRAQLYKNDINSHLAGVDSSPDVFFDTSDESVTFTGIYRAKGNEAGMVYIINAQDCYGDTLGNVAVVRNQLFTAITRSKAWVRVLGVGKKMQLLKNEFDKVEEGDFTLRFRYPTEDERNHLNIIHRDMTSEERKKVQKQHNDLSQILNDLEAGRIYPEDLGDTLERLMHHMGKVEK
ncbi:hypothetical protein AGMMS50229_03270 [Campylobacterota bacterium]|nr:hypothetical protein AGMMS50229_03270 [Campylobacterota bacterium]